MHWSNRLRFLRLPPDLDPGFALGDPQSELLPGDDWSQVTVPDPSGGPAASETIVGSGTVSSITADPEGRAVYIVTNDQDDDEDGGWHVAHLYVLDLKAGDFTDQTFLNGHTPDITHYRFNKVIRHDFGGAEGAINVASTIPGLAVTGTPTGPTRLQLPSGIPTPALGTIYPGENQLDVELRTRLTAVRNLNLPEDRLYIRLIGFAQNDPNSASTWPYAGAVMVLSLANPVVPTFLRTLTIPQVPTGEWYQVVGLDVLPPDPAHLGTNLQRNVFVVTAMHSKLWVDSPQDRLVVGEDGP